MIEGDMHIVYNQLQFWHGFGNFRELLLYSAAVTRLLMNEWSVYVHLIVHLYVC